MEGSASTPIAKLVACAIVLVVASCTASRPLTVFDRMVEAVNAGDARAYASVYAEDAVIAIWGSNLLIGRTAIENHEVELLKQFPGARLAFYDVWRSGDKAAAHYAVHAETADGRAMGHEGLLFYSLGEDGLIATEHRYLDSLTPMAQLGALGPRAVRAPPALPEATRPHHAEGGSAEPANVALVLECLEAWVAADRTRLLSMAAADCTVDELVLVEPFTGEGAVSKWSATWSGAVRDLQMEVVEVLAAGDDVLVALAVRGSLVGELGPVEAANAEFVVRRAVLASVRDGKIARLACFMNGRELAQAVGAWPTLLAK